MTTPTEFAIYFANNKKKKRDIETAYKINAPFGVFLEANLNLHTSTKKF